MAWVLDLDGVVWLGGRAVTGSAEAVARLRREGVRVVFLTNNSSLKLDECIGKLGSFGIPAEHSDVLTSAQAAATLVEPGSSALVCAGPGVEEALIARHVNPVKRGPADSVIVGWHSTFDYQALTEAMRAVKGGARLIGTNEDATYPTADGPIPGGGSLLAAVSYASETDPVVAGKPHDAIVKLVRERLDTVDIVVGDRPSTDGALARRLGVRFALVLSGVTSPGHDPVDPRPDFEATDLAALVADLDRSNELRDS